jgi:hypothetical protein
VDARREEQGAGSSLAGRLDPVGHSIILIPAKIRLRRGGFGGIMVDDSGPEEVFNSVHFK